VRSLALALLVVLCACGGGGPTNGGNNGVDNFTARIDGVDWNAEFAPAAVNISAGNYVVTAVRATGSNNYTMVFNLYNLPGPGTYPLGVLLSMTGGNTLISQPPSNGWTSPLNGNSGQIVITTLSATQMVGTFEFVAAPMAGTTDTRTITLGEFDIPITAGGPGVAPANKGGSASATVGANAFYASQFVQQVNSGTLTLLLTDDATPRSITFTIANMTGTGAYTLGASPLRVIQVGSGTGQAWTSNTAGGNGSVSLTVTADRISGTFTATVIGVGGGATGPMTISGTFNVGRG
jgi:hypothetical protein